MQLIIGDRGIRNNSKVVLYLRNGTNGDGTMTDRSPSAKGNASIDAGAPVWSSTVQLFGRDTIYLTADKMSFANHADWNFHDKAYTIEFWYKHTGSVNDAFLLWSHATAIAEMGYFGWALGTAKRWFMTAYGNSATNGAEGTADDNNIDDAMHHYALCFDGVNGKLYKDGRAVAGMAWTAQTTDNAGALIISGWYYNTGYRPTGYLAGYQITKGICKWTHNFTPPNRYA